MTAVSASDIPGPVLGPRDSVVIIGAGQAGSSAAVGLRAAGHTGPITLVGAETHAPYQRPPLSKKFLTRAAGAAQLIFHSDESLRSRGIDLRLGTMIGSLDRGRSVVVTERGEHIPYDHAILATGACNRELPVNTADAKALSLRSWNDAELLRDALAQAASVLVIGGGMIGLEVAASARELDKHVTVVEAAPVLLPRHLSRPVADYLQDLHAARGVRIHCGTLVDTLLAEGGRVVGARTSNGELRADVVIDAVGVRPVTGLAEECGLVTDGGIVVDSSLRTSDPQISAVGDCALVADARSGRQMRLESVQNATEQGAYLGRHLLGQDPGPYSATPWFWTDQYNVRVQMAGLAEPDQIEVVGAGTERFSVYCFTDDVLCRVESVGMVGEHLAARKVLATGCSPSIAMAGTEGFSIKEWWAERTIALDATKKG